MTFRVGTPQIESLREKKAITPISPLVGRSASAPRTRDTDLSPSRRDQMRRCSHDLGGSPSLGDRRVLPAAERLQLITGRLDSLGVEMQRKFLALDHYLPSCVCMVPATSLCEGIAHCVTCVVLFYVEGKCILPPEQSVIAIAFRIPEA